MSKATAGIALAGPRAREYYRDSLGQRVLFTNRVLMVLLAAEWIGLMVVATTVSPRVWAGTQSSLHPHLWAAILAGPCFVLPAIGVALLCPRRALTRHVLAMAQLLISILLSDASGGRIETHFHIFGSLAILAGYNDWRVLLTASLITSADHFLRGIWWPRSVYGVLTVSPWRWVEHVWWVFFEDVFLVLAARNSIRDLRIAANSKARLYEGASHDQLTGLANRRLLQQTFDSWQQGSAELRCAALLFLDLDLFRQTNERLGYAIGDKLLSAVAGRLSGAVGHGATLARFGGDEFVVFLENVSRDEVAIALGQRLLRTLDSPFHVDGQEWLVSASVGVSFYPEHGATLAALQEAADRAMYVAQSRGKNQCVVCSPEVIRTEQNMREIARSLSAAVSSRKFQLAFQPLVYTDGQPAAFEALLRWNHPTHGNVSPSTFVPLLESSGLIVPLGDWVLNEACRCCEHWQRMTGSAAGVTVNVSARQFDQRDYPERVFEALAVSGLRPSSLILELTEGALMQDLDRARSHLLRIREAGVRVALDDFGTGYSSLSYLTELPVDIIKLDHVFVNRELPRKTPILAALIGLAHTLRLQVVAEGVETETQREELTRLGCDYLQGYLFSRPLPPEEVESMLPVGFMPESSLSVPFLLQ